VKRASKVALGFCFAVAIIVTDMSVFHQEWIPLRWHLRHGFHAEMNGIRFTVPLLYDEDHGSQPNTLAFWKFPGCFSRKTAAVTVQTRKEPLEPRFTGGSEFRRTELAAALVGKEGKCVEYAGKEDSTLRVAADNRPLYIFCSFGENLYASFSGTLNAKEEFYAFLRNAELVNRKN
jgi:hypothetical protein